MMRILVTTEFCNGAKHLASIKDKTAINTLRTILILLANKRTIPKKYHDHRLTDNEFRELHVTGDVLLLYRYETDNCLVVSLKLVNITDHKKLNNDINKTYDYLEVSTSDLNDITSSTKLDDVDESTLIDVVENISDYSSMYTENGYILFDDYYFTKSGRELHCKYDYYLYSSEQLTDSIDFVIDLDKYKVQYISDLFSYIEEFSIEVANAFM